MMSKGYLFLIVCGFALMVSTPSQASVVDSTGAGFVIPDNNITGASSTIAIGVDETISTVQVNLFGLTHTWIGDLIARITAPSGTTADLLFRVGPGTFGDGSNVSGNYSFVDGGPSFGTAALAAGGNTVIAPGTYRAETNGDGAVSLNLAFAGESTLGNWTLSISDNAQVDTGSLGGWGVNIGSSVTAIPEPGPFVLFALAGIAMVKRRRRNIDTQLTSPASRIATGRRYSGK